MKTTIEISDALLRKAKLLVRERKTTLRAIIEEGLRKSLGLERGRARFKLKDCSYGKHGFAENFQSFEWKKIRDEIYGDRD